MSTLPDFESEKERQQWIINHADYWTVIRRHNMQNERVECPTLSEAEHVAATWLESVPEARLLIYAVVGIHDTFVKVVATEPT